MRNQLTAGLSFGATQYKYRRHDIPGPAKPGSRSLFSQALPLGYPHRMTDSAPRNTPPTFPDGRPYFRGFDPGSVPSPCFLVDRAALEFNLQILADVAGRAGATVLLALKGFSMFPTFDLVRRYLHGGCASGVHEARLAREEIGGEVHTFAPAYTASEMRQLLPISDHIVFNSIGQWRRHRPACLEAKAAQAESRTTGGRPQLSFGLRVNPEYSEGEVEIYDPCAPYSRLGIAQEELDRALQDDPSAIDGLEGIHFHTLCEQGADALEHTLEAVDARFGDILRQPAIKWLNMGGGHHITKPHYDRERLLHLVRTCAERYNVKVILEPGEAIAIHTGILVGSVLDTPRNKMDLAILDTSATAHMPDTLEMPYRADIWGAGAPGEKRHLYRLGGQTCLAGDVIGDYTFSEPLQVGDRLVFDDMAHYTMVKTTTFNGIQLPAIATYDSNTGEVVVLREFGYEEFKGRLG